MLTLPNPIELEIVAIADRGIPNRERIILRPNTHLNLQGFILGIGWGFPDAIALPIADRVFFFTEQWIDVESWVVVYTGKGETMTSEMDTGETAYSFHWGRSSVMFSNPKITAFVIKMASICVWPIDQTQQLSDKGSSKP